MKLKQLFQPDRQRDSFLSSLDLEFYQDLLEKGRDCLRVFELGESFVDHGLVLLRQNPI